MLYDTVIIDEEERLGYRDSLEESLDELSNKLVELEQAYKEGRSEDLLVEICYDIQNGSTNVVNIVWHSPFKFIYPIVMVLMELSLKLGTQSKDKEFFDLINFSFEAIDYMRRFMQFEIEPQELTKQKRLSRKCQKFVKKSIIIIEKMGLCDMVDSRTIMQMFNTGILLFNPTPLLLDGVREPLLAMGFKVYFATQVDSAFGLINKHSPFLILVDVNDDLKLAEDMIEEISQRDFRGFVYLVVDESTTESFCTINVNYSNILEKCFIAPFRFEDIYEEILEQKEVHDKNICVHF